MSRRPTSTSSFGTSRRESHDASGFYRRFSPPALSSDDRVSAERDLDKLIHGDARSMAEVPDSSVALVVTSPPYFAGKEYEEALGEGGVPATYLDYLDLLRDVFAECVRALEPGGRIAVNVANLGRRPYRSLSADVVGILQDDLGLLLRGEIVWMKQLGATGSCAWGSFQRPANPVLRDLTERVVIASKGRFDRAIPAASRARAGLPWEGSLTRDDFMEATLDVWEIPAERATRVGHPAPFPVELPARLINLYTYRDDLVLDPFLGSGTTAVAAVRTSRHYAGYDLDPSYIELAEARVADERRRLLEEHAGPQPQQVALPLTAARPAGGGDAPSGAAPEAGATSEVAAAVNEGRAAKEVARAAIDATGWADVRAAHRQPGGVEVSFTARDGAGRLWCFDVAGSFTTFRPGLQHADAVWKAIGKAAVLHAAGAAPLVLLTTGQPPRANAGGQALDAVTGPGKPLHAVIDLLRPSGVEQLRALCGGDALCGG